MAIIDGQACGFCYCLVDRSDRPGWGFIAEFYVDALHRRRGIGSRLFERAEALLMGAGAQSLWLTTNQAARSFWESKGLQATGEVADNGNAVMVKTLGRSPATHSPGKNGTV